MFKSIENKNSFTAKLVQSPTMMLFKQKIYSGFKNIANTENVLNTYVEGSKTSEYEIYMSNPNNEFTMNSFVGVEGIKEIVNPKYKDIRQLEIKVNRAGRVLVFNADTGLQIGDASGYENIEEFLKGIVKPTNATPTATATKRKPNKFGFKPDRRQ